MCLYLHFYIFACTRTCEYHFVPRHGLLLKAKCNKSLAVVFLALYLHCKPAILLRQSLFKNIQPYFQAKTNGFTLEQSDH